METNIENQEVAFDLQNERIGLLEIRLAQEEKRADQEGTLTAIWQGNCQRLVEIIKRQDPNTLQKADVELISHLETAFAMWQRMGQN